ncbi:hypothetical protein GCM10027295_05230 [Pseudaeromonas pectinilytica]
MRRESALAQGCAIADGHGSLPVSEDQAAVGAKALDCQGGGLFPLGPPPSTAGGQIANVCKAETDTTGSRPTL